MDTSVWGQPQENKSVFSARSSLPRCCAADAAHTWLWAATRAPASALTWAPRLVRLCFSPASYKDTTRRRLNLVQRNLTITYHICKEPSSKKGHTHRSQGDTVQPTTTS